MNKHLINKYSLIILFLMSIVFCQSNDKSIENYKIALRMKLRMESNPILYMDEPKSALLNKAYQSCNEYILLDEYGAKKVLKNKMTKITNDIKSFSKIKYEKPIRKKKPSNIRYHYFSLESDID